MTINADITLELLWHSPKKGQQVQCINVWTFVMYELMFIRTCPLSPWQQNIRCQHVHQVSALASANFWGPAAIVQSIGFHLSDRPEAQAASFLSFLTTRWSLPSMDSLHSPVHIPQSTGGKFRRLCMNVMSAVINCNQDHDVFENAYHILDWNMLLWLLYHQYLKEEGKRRAEGLQLFLELKKYPKPL